MSFSCFLLVGLLFGALLEAASCQVVPWPVGTARHVQNLLARDEYGDLLPMYEQFIHGLETYAATANTTEGRATSSGLAGACHWPPTIPDDGYLQRRLYVGDKYPYGIEGNGTCLQPCQVNVQKHILVSSPLDRVRVYHHNFLVPVPETRFPAGATCFIVERIGQCSFAVTGANMSLRAQLSLHTHLRTLGWIVDNVSDTSSWHMHC